MTEQFAIEAYSVKWLGYRDAADRVIFCAARKAGAVVMTKDSDFLRLLSEYGPPPRILWVTLGNTSNAHMRAVLKRVFPDAMHMLRLGETLIEICDR
ncbi:DUF5615 family PIN-like protein [Methylohalobius crimeensis]|uniref:DUF5615 family PIN-like protein n=1 Tax=Methylohalobius crimeensis TaxID=244365 RepID=UPI001F2F9C00|nr:DUF5615 family PIN-like protein [Methylohalobius crimeensis]